MLTGKRRRKPVKNNPLYLAEASEIETKDLKTYCYVIVRDISVSIFINMDI